jgi:hypothetical protein
MKINQFQAFADKVLKTVDEGRIKVPAKRRSVLAQLNALVDAAYDATARQMMEGKAPTDKRLLATLEAKFKAITEKWFVMSQLGVGNDLNPGSGGGDGGYNGLPPVPGMVKAGTVSRAAVAEKVKQFVDKALSEDERGSRPRYNAKGWVLGKCTSCGKHNYVEPHGMTAKCKCSPEETEHENIPFRNNESTVNEKWFVMPQLGVGNDLNQGSGGGDGDYNGLGPVQRNGKSNMVLAGGGSLSGLAQEPSGSDLASAPAATERIKRFVDKALSEVTPVRTDMSCIRCGATNKLASLASLDAQNDDDFVGFICPACDEYRQRNPETFWKVYGESKLSEDDVMDKAIAANRAKWTKQCVDCGADVHLPPNSTVGTNGAMCRKCADGLAASRMFDPKDEADEKTGTNDAGQSCKCGSPGCNCDECDECSEAVKEHVKPLADDSDDTDDSDGKPFPGAASPFKKGEAIDEDEQGCENCGAPLGDSTAEFNDREGISMLCNNCGGGDDDLDEAYVTGGVTVCQCKDFLHGHSLPCGQPCEEGFSSGINMALCPECSGDMDEAVVNESGTEWVELRN